MTPNTPLKTREEIVNLLAEAIHSRQGQEKHLWLDDCLKLAEASILELEKKAVDKFINALIENYRLKHDLEVFCKRWQEKGQS